MRSVSGRERDKEEMDNLSAALMYLQMSLRCMKLIGHMLIFKWQEVQDDAPSHLISIKSTIYTLKIILKPNLGI